MRIYKFILLGTFIFLLFSGRNLHACETCTISKLGKQEVQTLSQNQKWFVKYLFEEQNWHEKEAREAHNLHHQGHHFHDKTREFFHRLTIGGHPTERWTAYLEIPYVIRHSLEIDEHSILGSPQRSEGLGDVQLLNIYEFAAFDHSSLSAIAGIKLPTGETKQVNSIGTRFEPELQPGSGSLDYILGGLYKSEMGASELIANFVYVIKTEGIQEYEFGDLISTSALWQRRMEMTGWTAKVGLDSTLQYEFKHKDQGEAIKDSGGLTILAGPALSVETNNYFSVFGAIQFPVYEQLGGVHQGLDYTASGGIKLIW